MMNKSIERVSENGKGVRTKAISFSASPFLLLFFSSVGAHISPDVPLFETNYCNIIKQIHINVDFYTHDKNITANIRAVSFLRELCIPDVPQFLENVVY